MHMVTSACRCRSTGMHMIIIRLDSVELIGYILLSLVILMTLSLSLCTFRIWIEEMVTFFQISKFLKITKVSFLNLNLLIGRNHSFLTRTFSMHMTPALHDHYLSSEYNSYNTAYFTISQKTPISTLSLSESILKFILIRANHVKGLSPWIRCPWSWYYY